MLIRMALTDAFNELMAIHFGLVYGEYFEQGNYPWQFDFYSDQSAATTEALSNKQARMNMVIMKAQALQSLKELGLSKQSLQSILEEDGGMDYDTAAVLADSLDQATSAQDMAMLSASPQAQHEPDDELDDEFDDVL